MPTDTALRAVRAAILAMDPTGVRMGSTIRRTFDQLYDGGRTGRYRWDQLRKTEKIASHEVDCKYSQTLGGWMIPQEALGHLCLLMTADDQAAKWSVGLIRVSNNVLTPGQNRDTKRSLSATGCRGIDWLFKDEDLPPNVLLQLPPRAVEALMALRFGQQRINQIFRIAQGYRISGTVIETLGQQVDPRKRIRKNGGSRSRLKQEGIIILGDYEADREIARKLGVPVPREGEFVSVRVAPVRGATQRAAQGVALIDSSLWRVASSKDPIVNAPETPGQHP
jgi:hypothetical protein